MIEEKRHCMALTREGQPCRAWASDTIDGQPLCRVHAEEREELEQAMLAALTGQVVPQGTWAGAHGRRELYGVFFDEEEVEALEMVAEDAAGASLGAEVELARVVARRLLAEIADGGDLVKLAPLLLDAVRTVGRLLRDQQGLPGAVGEQDALPRALGEVLAELTERWGVNFEP